jgi:hypothetical protein
LERILAALTVASSVVARQGRRPVAAPVSGVDRFGQVIIDVLLAEQRDTAAARHAERNRVGCAMSGTATQPPAAIRSELSGHDAELL